MFIDLLETVVPSSRYVKVISSSIIFHIAGRIICCVGAYVLSLVVEGYITQYAPFEKKSIIFYVCLPVQTRLMLNK